MYLEHFGLSEPPFRITPHTDFFFAGAKRGATLDALLYAITHDEGIVKVSGEVGSGKTMLCRVLMERLPENVETIHLANPSLSREEILFTLADELKINLASNRTSAVLRALQEHLIERYAQGHQVVVLIDEAHAMPAETLEEIRLLSNLESNRHKLLQIVLFGQPELNDVLNRTEMRQLKERITHNFTLEPLVHADVAQYINFRMRAAGYKGPDVFSKAALKRIARASLGLTRRINILCDKALLAAFAANTHQISATHVHAAIRDADFRSPGIRASWTWAVAALALVLVAAVIYGWLRQPDPAEKTQAPPHPPAAKTMEQTPAAAPDTVVPVRTEPVPPVPDPALIQKVSPDTTAPVAPPSPPAQAATPDRMPAASDTIAAPAQAGTERLGPLTRQYLNDTQQWLAASPDSHWFIQLLTTDSGSTAHVEKFIAQLAGQVADPQMIRVYTAQSKGTQRLGVIYGDFASREAAAHALGTLPPPLKIYGAYPRQVKRLKN